MGIAKVKISRKLLKEILKLPDDIEVEGTYETFDKDDIYILVKGDSIPPTYGRPTAKVNYEVNRVSAHLEIEPHNIMEV